MITGGGNRDALFERFVLQCLRPTWREDEGASSGKMQEKAAKSRGRMPHGTASLYRYGTDPLYRYGTTPLYRHGTVPLYRYGTASLYRHGTAPLYRTGSPTLCNPGGNGYAV